MKKNKIPTIIGIAVLILGLASGVILVQFRQIFSPTASGEKAPKDVRITNITDTSFTISWITDGETTGFIKFGESEGALTKTEEDEIGGESFTHTVSLRGLSPETSYFLKINSAGDDFDNNGIAWEVKTGPEIPTSGETILISGTVLKSDGNPSVNSLVYFTLGGSTLSTTTSQNGSWVVQLTAARQPDLSAYLSIDERNTLVEISVAAGPDGVASAQIYPASAKPAPPIILGQTHDFKNLPPSVVSEIPEASIDLPEDSTASSGFDVPDESGAPSAGTVTLESIDEGEVVTTKTPEFFGDGPAGTTITITVESEPVTEQVKIPSSGSWDWSPPSSLSEGIHQITITWRDEGGILRTLKRTFVVQAAEGPAFESTPSATKTPSPTPTSTPTPTPRATSSASPSATPAVSPSATLPPEVPDSGTLTATLLMTIMGLGVFAFSFWIWRKSET